MEVWSLVLVSLLVSLGFDPFILPFQMMEGSRKCEIPKVYLGLE
jgi:hypothetical protein